MVLIVSRQVGGYRGFVKTAPMWDGAVGSSLGYNLKVVGSSPTPATKLLEFRLNKVLKDYQMVDFNKQIKNSDKFREPALQFIATGHYCSYPESTSEFFAYWDEQMDRCKNGYTADDGDYISGYNYFYLNFCPIQRIIYTTVNNPDGSTKIKKTRDLQFPDFYDYDYYFFQAVEDAETEGKHLCALKSRRKGYSYKNAAMACRNYYLFAGSKTYIYASNKQYLTEDGILTKAWDYMDFIDKNTAWGKKRSVNTQMRKRAGFFTKDEYGNEIELGFKSEIIGVTLKDNPDVVRGKAGKLIIFEEAGSFSELGAAWQIARPSVEQDGMAFGTMIAFGTGGDEDSHFETLKDMFYNPDGYNCIGFDNIWDETPSDKKCGFFIPQYTNMDFRDNDGNRIYMDNDGNTLRKKSLEYILAERKKVIENATNSVAVDRYVAEHCVTPQEACLEFGGNIFPKKELQEQLARIRTNKNLSNHKQVGDLIWNGNGQLEWKIKKVGDITHYPLNKDDDPTGSIVIWEHPMKDAPVGLYIGGCLLPGEKVLTDKGLKDVEKVDHNDMLINQYGKKCKIKVFQRRHKQNHDSYTVTPFSSYRSTTFTKEHPILTIDGFKPASELTEQDTLVIPNRYLNTNKDYIKYLSKLDGIDPNCKEFWWFLGIWLGDGCTNINKKSHDIYCAFGIKQEQESKEYNRVIREVFNRKTIACKANGGNTRRFTHKQLCLFINEQFGKYASNKRIPEWVKTAPTELKQSFLLGYLDADGSVFLDKGRVRVNFTSINLELLETIQDILFSCYIKNSIVVHQKECVSYFNSKPYISKLSYRINILSESIKDIFKDLHISINSNKLNKLKTYYKKCAIKVQHNIQFDCDRIYLKVKQIVKTKYTGTVYNFECDTHTYMCRNIVTHNCDPYDFDQSGTNSLGSCFIYKRFQNFENYYDIVVAEYTGRPSTAEEFYENVRKLIIYYNGRLMYENQNKGLFSYFIAKHCDYLLADQPDIINDIVQNSKVQRKKGCHMNKQIKQWAEGLIKDWLNEEKSPGKKNLHEILSEPLLEELISYNDTGNFDRVCALFQIMIYREQLYNLKVKEKKKENRDRVLFDGPIFTQEWFHDDESINNLQAYMF